MTKATKAPKPAYPKVVETYQEPTWALRSLTAHGPSTFNGIVAIRRYRVTVELIEEPVEVLRDRLRKLWRESEPNVHHRQPMRVVAEQLDMDPDELHVTEQGCDFKRRDAR